MISLERSKTVGKARGIDWHITHKRGLVNSYVSSLRKAYGEGEALTTRERATKRHEEFGIGNAREFRDDSPVNFSPESIM